MILVQKRLNEDVIDYDLLEDLVCHIDETCSEGAILVFLPVSPPLSPCTRMIITGNIQDSHDKLNDLTKKDYLSVLIAYNREWQKFICW